MYIRNHNHKTIVIPGHVYSICFVACFNKSFCLILHILSLISKYFHNRFSRMVLVALMLSVFSTYRSNIEESQLRETSLSDQSEISIPK